MRTTRKRTKRTTSTTSTSTTSCIIDFDEEKDVKFRFVFRFCTVGIAVSCYNHQSAMMMMMMMTMMMMATSTENTDFNDDTKKSTKPASTTNSKFHSIINMERKGNDGWFFYHKMYHQY